MGAADTLEDRAALQWDLDRLEKWTEQNFTNINQRKYEVLHL